MEFRSPENSPKADFMDKIKWLKDKIMKDSVMESGFMQGVTDYNQPVNYDNVPSMVGGRLRQMVVDPVKNYVTAGAKGMRGEPLTAQDIQWLIEGNTDWGVGASLGSGLMNGVKPNVASMFVSPSSTDIAKAKTMAAKGIPIEQIHRELLMHKKPDGFWRKEIDDSMAAAEMVEGKGINKLDQILAHPVLKNSDFSEQPISVHTDLDKADNWSSGNYLDLAPDNAPNNIINIDGNPDRAKNTLFHELQHAIQNKEGWARGGSPTEFKTSNDVIEAYAQSVDVLTDATAIRKIMERRNIDVHKAVDIFTKRNKREPIRAAKVEAHINPLYDLQNWLNKSKRELNKSVDNNITAHDQYRNLLGEREARDTASRINLSLDERRGLMPDLGQGSTVKMDRGMPQNAIEANLQHILKNKEREGGVSKVYRYNDSDVSPDNGMGYTMWANSSDNLSSYGDQGWEADTADLPHISEFLGGTKKLFQQEKDDGLLSPNLEHLSGDDIDDIVDPEDIVNSADAWDDPNFVEWFWEKIGEPNELNGVKLTDGAILFDQARAKKISPNQASTPIGGVQ